MTKSQLLKLTNEKLAKIKCKAQIIRFDNVLQHAEVLVVNDTGYGVAYLNIAVDYGYSVYGGVVLTLPSEFTRVYNCLDEKEKGAQ